MANLPTVTSGEYARVTTGYGVLPLLNSSEPPLYFALTGSGGVQVAGTAPVNSRTLLSFSLTGSGGVKVTGTAPVTAISTAPLIVTGSGGVKVSGTAPVTVVNVLRFSLVGSGGVQVTGTAPVSAISPLLFSFVGSGGVKVAGTAPMSGTAMDVTTGTIASTLPRVVGSAALYAGNSTIGTPLPLLTARMNGTVGTTLAVAAALPEVTSSLSGGQQSNNCKLPSMTAAFAAVIGISGGIGVTLPVPTAACSGDSATLGSVGVQLPSMQLAAGVIGGIIGSVNATARAINALVTGSASTSAVVSATLPNASARLVGSSAVFGTVTAGLPGALRADFTRRWIAAYRLTQVMNTLTTAVTTFTGYGFNSFAEIDGKYYAVDDTGLHRVDADDTVKIDWAMQTGQLDFGTPMQKRMSDFYIAMHADGPVTLTVSTDELGAYDYTVDPKLIQTIKQRRSLVGKGMRGRYWQFALTGTDDFDFDAFSMAVVDTSRRI